MKNAIVNREQLAEWLNERRLLGEMVEVGCAHGSFASLMLSKWHGKKYYMIDPWAKQDAAVYRESTNDSANFDAWYESCKGLAERDTRAECIRELSSEGVKRFKDGQLDCVYIDGNHALGAVLDDMCAWWPKIAPGGIMGGHDYQTYREEGWFCEVDMAVDRWTSEHNIHHYTTGCSSWWIHKYYP